MSSKDKVYITDATHLVDIGQHIAFEEAKATLKKAIEEYKINGIKIALLEIESASSKHQTQTLIKNVRFAEKQGLKLDEGELKMGFDDNGFYFFVAKQDA